MMNNTLLSIVTGTFNRLDYLRAMIQSVRDQLPHGIDYEFLLVDGGSTDGTLDWLREQGDVSVIAHGNLRGAIVAFCDGARAAHGDTVLLANDDVLFHDGGILRALVHLETHPTCGGVAFMDNRPAPGYDKLGYKVQFVPATAPDGRSVSVPYAQVGLFRRALGDAAGWWGDGDPIMRESRTYGGDNFLSARIWEMGYTIDAVQGCAVDDRLPQDDLRAQNVAHDAPMVSPYHRRFPNGVQIASQPKPDIATAEHLRILYLPLFSPGYGRYKRGLCDALARVGIVYELDYVGNRGRFISAVRDFQPHLILTQLHDAHTITAAMLDQARQVAPEGVVIVNWNGDVYADQLTAPDMLDLLKRVDLQTVVNADVLPVYAEHGIAAAYWQIGAEPVPERLPSMPAHDLLFMANAYSPARKTLGALLRHLDGHAGLYGFGWDEIGGSGNTFYSFAEGAALYRACMIAISDNQYSGKGFVSNRLFEALSNGAFVLQQTVPGLEELTGLVDGTHYVSWDDEKALRTLTRKYLKNDTERQRIAAAGEAYAREHFSFDARVQELFETLLPALRTTQPLSLDVLAALENAVADYFEPEAT